MQKVKVKVSVSVDDSAPLEFEGEEKDAFKFDVVKIMTANVPQLSIKFGDSGNTVQVQLRKVK